MRRPQFQSGWQRRLVCAPVVMSLTALTLSAGVWAQDLQTFHEAALAHDPQWLAARHALDAARQRPGQARAALLPQLTYTATRNDQKGTLYFADEEPVPKDVQARTRVTELQLKLEAAESSRAASSQQASPPAAAHTAAEHI